MKYLNLCLAGTLLPLLLDVTNAIPSHLSRPWNKQYKEFQGQGMSVADLRGGAKSDMVEMELTGTQGDAPFSSMLRMSNLVYRYAELRQIVLDHGANFNEDLTPKERKKKGIVEFDSPDLVITKRSNEKIFKTTLLKHEITADCLLEFIQKNRKYLSDKKVKVVFDKNGSNTEELNIEKRLKILKGKFDADIIEFDDDRANKGTKSELLYGIAVNRTDKRITVVFRGSSNIRDWLQNIKFVRKTPPEILEFASEDVDVHMGFTNYLFKKPSRRDENTKYEQILDVLEEVYAYKAPGRDYSKYEMYVTGHSLGGALTQLMAFTLAGSPRSQAFLPANKPVTAISYASPDCGTKGYLEKFNELEKKNKLRHIRVSNNGDVVPIILSTGTPWAGFKQPGVNVHLHPKKKAEIAYNKIKRNFVNPITALDRHSLKSHRERLYLEDGLANKDILSKSVEEIYSEYAN